MFLYKSCQCVYFFITLFTHILKTYWMIYQLSISLQHDQITFLYVCLTTVWLRWVYSVAPAYIFAKKQPIYKWYIDIKQKQNWKSAERRREESVMVNKYDLECFEQRKLKVLRLLCLEKGEDNLKLEKNTFLKTQIHQFCQTKSF